MTTRGKPKVWKRNRPIITCRDCGEDRPHKARGLCCNCYKRRLRANNWEGRPTRPKPKIFGYNDKGKPIIECKNCGERRWHHAHGLCSPCYLLKWAAENPEKLRAGRHCYYLEHKEKRNQYSRKHYREHREHYQKLTQQWREANPEKVRESSRLSAQRRRAKKRGLPDTLTPEQIAQILNIGHCFYCEEEVGLTLDHFVAVGAESNLACGTTRANSVAACQSCNTAKGTKMPEDILKQLNLLEIT